MSRRKWQALLTTALPLILLVVFALGTATAEPKKNQIVVEDATCKTDDGQSSTYTFVINGMAKTGLLTDSTGNIVVTSYTITYYDEQGNLLDTDTYDTGTKLNSQDDILSCTGQVDTTLQGLGDVTAVYEFKGFLTPPTG
jgi:hypothetical protein